MAYDLGDVVNLGVTTYNDTTGVVEDATSATLTITLPDGTSVTPTVSHTALTGIYSVAYPTVQTGRHGVRWVTVGTATVASGAYTDVFDVNDVTAEPIVSLADFKAHLNITGSTNDEELRYTLAVATEFAERYVNRSLRRTTLTEVYDGGGQAIVLRSAPIISVTTVVENGVTLTGGGVDYTINPTAGMLYRGSTIARLPWYPGRQCVTVTYVSGYANPPLVAQRGVMDIGRWMWQQSQQGPRPGFGQSANDPTYSADALPTWLFRPLDALQKIPGIA